VNGERTDFRRGLVGDRPPPGSGQSSRDRLVDNGEIMRAGTPWRVVDPIDADWIRRRFPL
jgi:hypothetical protein